MSTTCGLAHVKWMVHWGILALVCVVMVDAASESHLPPEWRLPENVELVSTATSTPKQYTGDPALEFLQEQGADSLGGTRFDLNKMIADSKESMKRTWLNLRRQKHAYSRKLNDARALFKQERARLRLNFKQCRHLIKTDKSVEGKACTKFIPCEDNDTCPKEEKKSEDGTKATSNAEETKAEKKGKKKKEKKEKKRKKKKGLLLLQEIKKSGKKAAKKTAKKEAKTEKKKEKKEKKTEKKEKKTEKKTEKKEKKKKKKEEKGEKKREKGNRRELRKYIRRNRRMARRKIRKAFKKVKKEVKQFRKKLRKAKFQYMMLPQVMNMLKPQLEKGLAGVDLTRGGSNAGHSADNVAADLPVEAIKSADVLRKYAAMDLHAQIYPSLEEGLETAKVLVWDKVDTGVAIVKTAIQSSVSNIPLVGGFLAAAILQIIDTYYIMLKQLINASLDKLVQFMCKKIITAAVSLLFPDNGAFDMPVANMLKASVNQATNEVQDENKAMYDALAAESEEMGAAGNDLMASSARAMGQEEENDEQADAEMENDADNADDNDDEDGDDGDEGGGDDGDVEGTR